MSALDELKAKVKTSYIEECIIWALKTDAYKTAAISELNSLRSERDALKVALEYIRNYDNYASDGDVYIEDGNSYTHVSNYAESVIKAYSAGNE